MFKHPNRVKATKFLGSGLLLKFLYQTNFRYFCNVVPKICMNIKIMKFIYCNNVFNCIKILYFLFKISKICLIKELLPKSPKNSIIESNFLFDDRKS